MHCTRHTVRRAALTAALFVATAAIALWPGAARAAFPRAALSEHGMVTSAHHLATDAGVEILEKGGNAVDAAVATVMANSVVLPFSAGLGGGGFLLLHLEKTGQTLALDFRERAPLSAHRDMYLGKDGKVDPKASVDGYLSIAVPGTVAGMRDVHQKHGKLPWAVLLEPAIRLAQRGFAVTERYTKAFAWRKDALKANPEAWRTFTKNGAPLAVGDLLVQPDLAQTLRTLAVDPNAFYQGTIAQMMVDDVQKGGGLLTRADLAAYQTKWMTPVCSPFRGTEVCSMPPPSSGGVHLHQMLRLYDLAPAPLAYHSVDEIHWLTESMRIAYADRAVHLGDPAFVDVPVKGLIAMAYAKKRATQMSMARAQKSSAVVAENKRELAKLAAQKVSEDTSHLNVVDKDKNAVSLTFTINYGFGSGVVAKGTGILMNDEMDDFAAAPGTPNAYGLLGGEANSVQPRKTPLSSMTPVVVKKAGKLSMVCGSPGGSTIITTSLQCVLNVVVHHMNAAEAVAAPRLHHQWMPDVLTLETWGFDPATTAGLEARGHTIKWRAGWGNASAVVVRPDGTLEGGADPRGDGAARGPLRFDMQ